MGDLQQVRAQVREGNATGALASAKAAVRDSPSDPACRTALFSLFAIHGEWDRARDQLETAIRMGGDAALAVYDVILRAVSDREKVMSGEAAPHFPGDEVPAWFPEWQSALAALHAGDDGPLAEVAGRRAVDLEGICGFNEEYEFEGFRNCDTRLCGIFEGVFEGRYSWLPFEQVLRLAVPERPELLQDLVWLAVMIHLKRGEPLKGYLFSTLPGTALKGTDAEKLAKSTDWDGRFEAVDVGTGAQLFALGSEIIPLFSLGQCCLNTPANTGETPASAP